MAKKVKLDKKDKGQKKDAYAEELLAGESCFHEAHWTTICAICGGENKLLKKLEGK